MRIGIPADAVSLSERAADRNTLTREESRKPPHRRPSQRVGARKRRYDALWMTGDGRLHGRRYKPVLQGVDGRPGPGGHTDLCRCV